MQNLRFTLNWRWSFNWIKNLSLPSPPPVSVYIFEPRFSRVKTSKALMRHTILVKHIYCAIYFAFLFLFARMRFSQIKTFTAKAKYNFLRFFSASLQVQTDDKRFSTESDTFLLRLLI
jgi:hypothetical protein